MSRALADTSLYIARESGRQLLAADIPDELSVSVITVGELGAGVLAAADIATRDRGHLSNGVKLANKCSTNTS